MLACLIGAIVAPAISGLETHIVAASLFKNGYAVVTRETRVPGSGTYTISAVNNAVLGTAWISASNGITLEEVTTVSESTERSVDFPSILDFFRANVGKSMKFKPKKDEKEVWIEGKILGLSGDTLWVKTEQGILSLDGNQVQVWSQDSSALTSSTAKETKRMWKIKLAGNAPGSIYTTSLELGITWVPNYAVDISGPSKLNLLMKTIVMNDLDNLSDTEVKLITGFPNVPYLNFPDAFTTSMSVDQFRNLMMQVGTADKYRNDGAMANQAMNSRAGEKFDDQFPNPTGEGAQNEDLFFYSLGKISLQKGERGYYHPLKAQADYEHVYEWEIPNPTMLGNARSPGEPAKSDIWHTIRFKNTSKQPFTTASAIVVKDNEVLGQDLMTYVSVGAQASLKISKSLDIQGAIEEREESRTIVRKINNDTNLVRFTIQGNLSLANFKSKASKLVMTRTLEGTLVNADASPTTTKMTGELLSDNPTTKLIWTITLEPGSKKTVKYSYTRDVRIPIGGD